MVPWLVKRSAQTTPAETIFIIKVNIMSMFPTLTPVTQYLLAGTGQDGVTGFEQLLMRGAVVELSSHVDTIGGGGAPRFGGRSILRGPIRTSSLLTAS